MITRLPYLQNAASWFYSNINDGSYIQWMKNQGVIMPIKMQGNIDSVCIEFTDPESEAMFILRWA